MEVLEEEVLIQDLGELIRRCTGDLSLPDPSQVIRQVSSWKHVFSHQAFTAWLQPRGLPFYKTYSNFNMCISEPRGFLTQTSLALIASLAWRCPTRDHWSESPHHIHFYADWSSKASVVSGRAPGWPMRSTKVRETFGFLGFIRDMNCAPKFCSSVKHQGLGNIWGS